MKSWVGVCGKPASGDPPLCEEHSTDKCWCGRPAVNDCSSAGSFVCGTPLCADHDCPAHGSLETRFAYAEHRSPGGGEEARLQYEADCKRYAQLSAEIVEAEKRARDLRIEQSRLNRKWGWWNMPDGDL